MIESIHRAASLLVLPILIAAASVGCSEPPTATGTNRVVASGRGTKTTSKTPASKCMAATSKDGMKACFDCCYAASPGVHAAADPLGRCNKKCGSGGDDACFASCEEDYERACSATASECDTYDSCTRACFGG